MKVPWEVERLSSTQRRRFLQWMGGALAAPIVSDRLRYMCNEVAGGVAYANTQAEGRDSIFIEVNYRDQWDHGHFFVSPGIATEPSLIRGERGKRCAMFFESNELERHRVGGGASLTTDVYLTPQSRVLAPHLDNIAMLDLCVLTFGGIHGHEAGNPTRTPGRYNRRDDTPPDDYLPIWAGDRSPERAPRGGDEAFWARVPTPASLHNRVQRLRNPDLTNGFAFKGIGRDRHTVYHFGAGLPYAELERIQSREALVAYGNGSSPQAQIVDSSTAAETLTAILRRIDRRFLEARRVAESIQEAHESELSAVRNLLHRPRRGSGTGIDFTLSEEERDFWSSGVPDQRSRRPKGQIWEQVAWAYRAVSGGIRTVALEFDYLDVHGSRSEDQMRVMTAQTVLPLVRLIENLKADGMWDRTTIAIYTLDGGRAPAAYSNGNQGKNTLILAGGQVRGGYFGDIRLERPGDDQRFSYHRPDERGVPLEAGVVSNSQRVEAAPVYRTVLRAAGVPNTVLDGFEDLRGAGTLDYMVRG